MMRAAMHDQSADVIVVGGGLAGLATAALVARAGRSVVLFERADELGGRAVTHVRQGAAFNIGPHALYCCGRAFRLFRELQIPFTGRLPKAARGLLIDGDAMHSIPLGIASLVTSRAFTVREKVQFIRILGSLRRAIDPRLHHVPLREWIDQQAATGRLARFLETLCRVSTYADDVDRMSSGAALEQLKLALEGNVWYLDGGWQTLVDGLRVRALEKGAELRTQARIASLQIDPSGVCVRLVDGAKWRGRAVVLAVKPQTAVELLGLSPDSPLARWTLESTPVRAASLDVALNGLPRPDRCVAFGLDRPLYFSVHSASARLAPDGVAVLHVMKYLGKDAASTPDSVRLELESFLDRLQPGWRDRTVTLRYLPAMMVAPSLPRADAGGLKGRPGVSLPDWPNIFLAGDWVGEEGMLADASAASAAEAAGRVLEALSTTPARRKGSLSHAAG
jgi:phytoene dehydrogenase-like protein